VPTHPGGNGPETTPGRGERECTLMFLRKERIAKTKGSQSYPQKRMKVRHS